MASGRSQRKDDVRSYCDTVYKEISEMKIKAFDLVCYLETTTAEEEARKEEFFELFDLLDYLEQKLASLMKDCPSDWRAALAEIESGRSRLQSEMEWWFG